MDHVIIYRGRDIYKIYIPSNTIKCEITKNKVVCTLDTEEVTIVTYTVPLFELPR